MKSDISQPKTGTKRGKYLATRYRHIVRYPGNNLYYLYWKFKGKRHELSLDTTIETIALVRADKEMKAIKSSVSGKTQTVKGKISLGKLLDRFLQAETTGRAPPNQTEHL